MNADSWDRGISGSATFDNGVIYIGNHEALIYALNATDGSVIWKKNLNRHLPDVYKKRFPYADTGNMPHPRFPATEEFYIHHEPDAIMTLPLVVGSKVFVGIASNTADLPCATGRIVALDKYSGNILWERLIVPDRTEYSGESQQEDENNGSYEAYNFGGGVWSTPAFDNEMNRLYVATGNPCGDITEHPEKYPFNYGHSLLALNPDNGKIIWYYTKTEYLGKDVDFGSSPVIFYDDKGEKYVGALSKGGDFVAIKTSVVKKASKHEEPVEIKKSDIADGSAGWEIKLAPSGSSPHDAGGINSTSFLNGKIYVGVGKKQSASRYTGEFEAAFLAINPSNRSIEMEYELQFTPLGASAGANNMIFFSNGREVVALDAESAGKKPEPLWISETLEKTQKGIFDYVQPLLGGIAISNGYLLIGSVNALYAFSVL